MGELSATVKDYDGRTIDLLAFDGAVVTGESQLQMEFVLSQKSGAVITGIEKLVQRFLIELLTEQGSLHYKPSRGTLFMTQIRSGMLRTSQDLFSQFSSAEVDIRNNLRQEEDVDKDPEDERYRSAELVSASLSGDTATLTIKISSVAGDTRQVIYPLRVGV